MHARLLTRPPQNRVDVIFILLATWLIDVHADPITSTAICILRWCLIVLWKKKRENKAKRDRNFWGIASFKTSLIVIVKNEWECNHMHEIQICTCLISNTYWRQRREKVIEDWFIAKSCSNFYEPREKSHEGIFVCRQCLSSLLSKNLSV